MSKLIPIIVEISPVPTLGPSKKNGEPLMRALLTRAAWAAIRQALQRWTASGGTLQDVELDLDVVGDEADIFCRTRRQEGPVRDRDRIPLTLHWCAESGFSEYERETTIRLDKILD